jgi:tetratricopeptide (TPR) repeat protein
MDTSPDLLTRLVNDWRSLSDGTRDGIKSGLAVALVLGAAGVFRNALTGLYRRIFKTNVPPVQQPQIQPQPPIQHEFTFKVDTSHLIPPQPIEPPKAEPPKVEPPAPAPEFLRPPAFGFVARRDEEGRDIIGRLKEELAPGRNQLVTLSGKGGVGKTTLAAEAFRVLNETYEGRLVWSDATARAGYTLSTLLDDAATQLGHVDLRALAPEAKEAAVRALFAERPALVALDNYETIDKVEQERIEDWLAHTPCSSLTTSRQKIKDTLNIVIPTMPLDEAQEFLAKRIAQTQEPQLFTPEVRQRIYETAEGNPFLMEWVVAQVDDAQEANMVLEELKHGEGDAAARVFGRSFNLPQVGDDGRAALLALSLFVPSASRPALAAVAGFGDNEKRLSEALKSLHALWLVKGLDGYSRFTVEGLTRSLTSARLSKEGRADEFRQRFIAYFLQYAVSYGQPTPEDYDALEAERDNLLSAPDAAFAREDWISVERMAFALAMPPSGMLYVRGYWAEALRINEIALKAARLAQDEAKVAKLAHNAAMMYGSRGDLNEARKLYNESLEINKRLGDQSGVAITLHQLGRLAQDQGDIDEARRLYNQSLEIKKRLGDQSSVAGTLDGLGLLEKEEGNVAEAVRLLSESLSIFERLGSPNAELVRQHLEWAKGKN